MAPHYLHVALSLGGVDITRKLLDAIMAHARAHQALDRAKYQADKAHAALAEAADREPLPVRHKGRQV